MYYTTKYFSPVGKLTMDSDGENLVGLWIQGQKYYGGTITGVEFEKLVSPDTHPVFKTVKQWLDQYFSGERPSISELPLRLIGGEFRQGVWNILREIPYGEVTTYGEIAKKMAGNMGKARMSSQAVGGAVAHNPLSIIIPCHRVVGTNGSLTGYAGGIDLKVKLLEHEGVDMTHLFVPKKWRGSPQASPFP